MSNRITDVIVHKLIKNAEERTAEIDLRELPLAVNPAVQRLIDELYKQYEGRIGKGFGKFEEDDNEYPVQRFVRDHLSGKNNFLELSELMMRHLKARAAGEIFATGGYVLIAKVSTENREYLLTAIVTEVIGMAITEGLEIVESVHLDMNQLRVAGRIDITTWLAGGEKYLSFLKGKTDIAGYFKKFLGCNDIHIALDESRKLVAGIEAFAAQKNLSVDELDALLSTCYKYLSDLSKDKQPVELAAFTNHVWPQEPQVLRDVLTEPERAISDGFVPDRRALKSLVKFEATSRFWKLTFDRQGLRNNDVYYDEARDTLVLSNIPDALRQELLAERRDDNDSDD